MCDVLFTLQMFLYYITSLNILHKVYLKQYILIYSNLLLVLFIIQLHVILSGYDSQKN